MSIRIFNLLMLIGTCIIVMLPPSVVLAQAAPPEAPKKSDLIAAGGRLLPGDQVRKMYRENTVYHVWLVAYRGVQKHSMGPVFSPDERHARSIFQGRKVDVVWWMDGDARCAEGSDGGPPACRLYYELKDKTFGCIRESDLCPLMVRAVPGNPEGM